MEKKMLGNLNTDLIPLPTAGFKCCLCDEEGSLVRRDERHDIAPTGNFQQIEMRPTNSYADIQLH